MTFIRSFKNFQSNRNVEEINEEKVNETAIMRDDKFIINGVVVKKSFISSYAKKVKDQTGKKLNQIYSDEQIAEELVRYLIDTHGEVEKIPVSALLGGEEGMEEEVEDVSMEEEPVDVSNDTIELSDENVEEEDNEESQEENIETEDGEESQEDIISDENNEFENPFDGESKENEDKEEETEDENLPI